MAVRWQRRKQPYDKPMGQRTSCDTQRTSCNVQCGGTGPYCNAMQCRRRRAKQTSAVPCGPDVSSTNARCVRHARCTHTECVMQAACCVLHIVRSGEAERSGAEWSGRDKYHSKYVAPEFELSESVLEHSRLTAAHSAVDYVTALQCVLYCCIFIMCVAC